MKKKIFTFLLFLFLSSCGYEAIYSVKNRTNYNFIISELALIGDRQTNMQIKRRLNSYSNPSIEEGKKFSLEISSNSEKIITTKDAAGDATKFKNEITVTVRISMNGIRKKNFVITESFSYDNNSNAFELKTYENRIKNNLAEAVVDKMITKLSKII